MIRIYCECGKKLKVATEHFGRTSVCPDCQKRVSIIAPGFVEGEDKLDGMFVVTAGPSKVGTQLFLGGREPIEIGKAPDAHIRLICKRVSKQHCLIRRTDYSWRVEDRESTNGLLVNGRRVRGANLLEGDVIRIGSFELRFMTGSSVRHMLVPDAVESDEPADTAEMDALVAPVEDDAGETKLALQLEDSQDSTITDGPPISMPIDREKPVRLDSREELELAPLAAEDDHQFTFIEDDEAADAAENSTIEEELAQVRCPSCRRHYPASVMICTNCGINIRTGRSLRTSQEADLNTIYPLAEEFTRLISFLIPFGLYPIASEAFGTKRPYVIRAVALITIVVSGWFLYAEISRSPNMYKYKNLMLWTGDGAPDPYMLADLYEYTHYGDSAAFKGELAKIEQRGLATSYPEDVLEAHNKLTPEQQCLGKYEPYQLITHAFLHGGLLHLAGNMLFLMVFGTRVNALIGNFQMLIVYPVLAIAGGIAHAIATEHMAPTPMLGASGAIMGLAGMYLVFFPVHKVHMALWWRPFWLFPRWLKLFAVRGFGVVLFYIFFDVFFTAFRLEDDVAHWAHLGGFMVGVALALVLLATRVVKAHGGDIFSVIFGRWAWPIVGRPIR